MAKKLKVKKGKDRDEMKQGEFSFQENSLSGNRIWCAMSKTINIGNYESLRAECGRGRIVPEGDDFDEAMAALKEEVLVDTAEFVDIIESVLKK